MGNLILISIFLSTTDIFRFQLEFLSPFRISIFLLSGLFIIILIQDGTIRKGNYFRFIVAIAISSTISVIVSINKEWAKSIFFNDMFGIAFMFIMANSSRIISLDKMFKAIIYSQFITIVFSIFTLFQYYFKGMITKNINILGVLSAQLDEEFVSRATIWGIPRLSLPYATPPHLSIIMILVISILILRPKLFPNKMRYFLITSFAAILLLTFSRTAIVTLTIATIIYLLIKLSFLRFRISKIILILLFGSIGFFVAITSLGEIAFLSKFANRFSLSINEIMQDRHLLVPLDGILLWLSNIRYFVFGIGAGSSLYMEGLHTYLPPHFLNSLITLIVDRGLIGLFLVIELTKLLFKSLSILSKVEYKTESSALAFAYLNIYISFFFYESRQNILIWIIISMVYMYYNHNRLIINN